MVAIIDLSLIWYVGRLVDFITRGSPAEVWAAHGGEMMAVGAAVLLLRPLLSAVNTAVLHNGIVPGFITLIRWRAHRQVLRQPVGFFEGEFAGRLANRVMQTPQSANDAVFNLVDAAAFAATTLVGSLIVLGQADVRLMLPLLIWAGLYALLLRWTVRHSAPAAQAASDARSAVTGRVVDAYANVHTVKLFAHGERELAHAREAMETARRALAREMRVISGMDIMLTLLNGFMIVGTIGWALYFWYQGTASVGLVAAASALVLRLNNLTYWIIWATAQIFQALGVVQEGMETIARPVDLTDRPGAVALRVGEGRIVFDGVSHHYGRGRGGLDHVSLDIRPGERIGLIGRSGAGKSTLVRLLLRFYDPEGGRILIDGQDIAHVTQDSLRRQIGMVQQDSSLLHRSVRENILYGRPDATEAEMVEAARRAEAHDFILDLEDPQGRRGYDAHVGERGVKLSGGQRQRIALARVILKDAPILVLDEATSALDSEVEAEIQDTLYGVMEGKTVIAIAHRLSTIAAMDRIVVLDAGRIVEEGRHAELLAKGGLYAGFWARQSGGFLGTDGAEPGLTPPTKAAPGREPAPAEEDRA